MIGITDRVLDMIHRHTWLFALTQDYGRFGDVEGVAEGGDVSVGSVIGNDGASPSQRCCRPAAFGSTMVSGRCERLSVTASQ